MSSEQSVEQPHTHKRGKNDSDGRCVVAGCALDRFPMWWNGYEIASTAAQEREWVLVEALQEQASFIEDYCYFSPDENGRALLIEDKMQVALRAVGALEEKE